MSCTGLANLRRGWEVQTICVRVSRLWHYHGGLETGPAKLVHMVIVDEKGTSGYAVVPTFIINSYIDLLHEGVVYEFSRFMVLPRQYMLNPTDASLMVMFTQLTTMESKFHLNATFPEWSYRLTPIGLLPIKNDTPENYVDVIGVITGISPVESFLVPRTDTHVFKRRIVISHNSGHEVAITLWGERAIRFNGQSIHYMGQTDPAVAIFVGTTVCTYNGSKELAGGCACKWFINVDIPEINIFRSSLPNPFPPIVNLPAPAEIFLQVQHGNEIPRKLVAHLMNLNLYEKEPGMFRCNVTISKVPSRRQWWGTFCTTCSSFAVPATSSSTQPDFYECSRRSCSCMTATLRFTLFVHAKDQTGEAEFAMYGATAQHIVGLSPLQVLRNSTRHEPHVPNAHVAASLLRGTPPDLNRLISMECKFIVRVSHTSFHGRWPTFQVVQVESFRPIQPNLSVMDIHIPS